MACSSLTAGIPKRCTSKMGGSYTFFLTEKSNVVLASGATNGYIDSITMSGGTKFYEFVVSKDTCKVTDTFAPFAGNNGGLWNEVLSLNFSRNEASVRNQIKILVDKELIGIVKNNDGSWWYFGKERGLNLGTAVWDSGAAPTDINQWAITLVGAEVEPAYEVDPDIIASLI